MIALRMVSNLRIAATSATFAGRGIGHGARLWLHALTEYGDQFRVQPVGFSQPAHGASKGAKLCRVHHGQRHCRRDEGGGKGDLKPELVPENRTGL
jgi:hypothetical protein